MTAMVWAGGEPARPRAGDLLERRGDRLDGAEVGTGADHDRDARLLEPAHTLGEVTHRGRRRHHVRDVVGADEDHRHVGVHRQGPGDLVLEVGGAGADHGEVAQVDPTVGVLGHAAGQDRSGGLLDPLHAVPGRGGVAEQRDAHRRGGTAASVPAGGVRRRVLDHRADGLAGQLGLGRQHAVETGAEHGEPASAVRRRRGELACCCCLTHGPHSRDRVHPRRTTRRDRCPGVRVVTSPARSARPFALSSMWA